MKMKRFPLITAGIAAVIVLIFSFLSLTKLGGIGDGDPLYTSLRIINRDTLLLAFSIVTIIFYLWKKEK